MSPQTLPPFLPPSFFVGTTFIISLLGFWEDSKGLEIFISSFYFLFFFGGGGGVFDFGKGLGSNSHSRRGSRGQIRIFLASLFCLLSSESL